MSVVCNNTLNNNQRIISSIWKLVQNFQEPLLFVTNFKSSLFFFFAYMNFSKLDYFIVMDVQFTCHIMLATCNGMKIIHYSLLIMPYAKLCEQNLQAKSAFACTIQSVSRYCMHFIWFYFIFHLPPVCNLLWAPYKQLLSILLTLLSSMLGDELLLSLAVIMLFYFSNHAQEWLDRSHSR